MDFILNLLQQQLAGITISALGILLGFLTFYIIRKTKTKRDDEILAKYIEPAFEKAYNLIPEKCEINWLKLTKNMLGSFISEYTKQNEMTPTASEYERFKQLATDFAKEKNGISVVKF